MASSRKLKVGIIGTGGISGVHYNGYTQSGLADVVALCDINGEVLAAKSEAYKVPADRCFKYYQDLLKLDLDAVSVCTPNKWHWIMTVDALKAGKHVLCEKPMAMNPSEAQKMVAAAEQSGKQLQIGLMNRYSAEAEFIKRMLDDGVLGDIYYGRAQAIRRRGVPSWGVFGQMEEQGGGGLIDIGVHMIDLCWHLMGKPIPVSVTGSTFRTIGDTPGHVGSFGPWDWQTYTVEDFAAALVRFENGAIMNIECSFNSNLDRDRNGVHVVGTKGGAGTGPLSLQIEAGGHLLDATPNHVQMVDLHGNARKVGLHEKEVGHFCQSLVEKRPVAVPGHEVIWVQKMINAIYKSGETGKEVRIR